jgi:signal transduction histidine kinase/ligand-binding sensor domain-containing protein
MSKRRYFLQNTALFFLLVLTTQAQYRFDFWTNEDGLPQNSVYSILQTQDGYIWFTTLDGLVRFDGIEFKVFNRGNSPGLTSNRLLPLLAEDDNTLWVGTEDGGLLRFRSGIFRAFSTADGLPSVKVTKFYKDYDGNLLAASQNGLARFDGEKFITENRLGARDYALYYAPSGVRWELTQNGLTATRDGKITNYELPFEINKISPDRTFNFPSYVEMLEDRQHSGVLWLTAATNLYRLENGVFKTFSSREGMPPSLVRAIEQDASGGIWLGSEKDGLCRFSENRVTCYTTADGLSHANISGLFIDREQTLWVATTGRGINRVTRKAVTTLSKKEGLLDGNVYPILEDRRGDFWIGAFSALSLYKNGLVTNFTRRDGLLYEIVQSLCEDKNGRIWIGSLGGVEYLENGQFVDFTEELNLPVGDYDFWDIYQTSDGAVWFATNKGLFRNEAGNTTKYAVEDGLPSNDIKKIFQAANGDLWFGTLGGLARFDGGKFQSFTEQNGLPGNHVRTIYQDAAGLLWIGSYDGGLSLFRDGLFTKITIENGLFSNGVFQILPDERGNFWMSSNQGIYRVSRQQLIDFADGKIASIVSTAFGKSDGMLNAECNGGRSPAGIKTTSGKLWFPTQDGVAIVDPEVVPFNPLPPPVVIESVKIDNIPANATATDGLSEYTIQPSQNNLEISYTGLSFIKSEQMQFRYRLEGLDEIWTNAGTRREVYYPYLPPGKYTFRVVAANSDNVWNEQGAAVQIVVLPPFYRTWWFIGLTILSFGAIGFTLYQRRVSEFKRSHAVQVEFSRRLINAHESERRRIAAELHDSLGQSLAMIKNSAVFGAETAENLPAAKEQLAEISTQSAHAIAEVREISYNLRPYLLDRLGLTKAIKSLLNKINDTYPLNINSEIEDVDGLFENDAEISIYRIIQESLNNILKHSEATEVKVSIAKTERAVLIKISDNGKGFDTKANSETRERDGFGLLGMSERVRMLSGTILVESELLKGTTLMIQLETGQNRLR